MVEYNTLLTGSKYIRNLIVCQNGRLYFDANWLDGATGQVQPEAAEAETRVAADSRRLLSAGRTAAAVPGRAYHCSPASRALAAERAAADTAAEWHTDMPVRQGRRFPAGAAASAVRPCSFQAHLARPASVVVRAASAERQPLGCFAGRRPASGEHIA
jgi:hypothetical protein